MNELAPSVFGGLCGLIICRGITHSDGTLIFLGVAVLFLHCWMMI